MIAILPTDDSSTFLTPWPVPTGVDDNQYMTTRQTRTTSFQASTPHALYIFISFVAEKLSTTFYSNVHESNTQYFGEQFALLMNTNND
jgi:hypothetical protein